MTPFAWIEMAIDNLDKKIDPKPGSFVLTVPTPDYKEACKAAQKFKRIHTVSRRKDATKWSMEAFRY